MDRRSFLKTSLATTASFTLSRSLASKAATVTAQATATAKVIGANSEIRYAVVGLNGRGKNHLDDMRKVKRARLVALCDVDSAVLANAASRCKDQGNPVQTYTDIRKLLEDQTVDAITIATPNHWHSLAAIWAMQAGKDVYVEKPVSHNLWEGRQLVNAARKYNCIVQAGTQCRSSSGIADAIDWVQAGNIGKILRARGLCYKRRDSIGKVGAPQPAPATVDYDLWCGPAPKDPLLRRKLHYDWHWVWPTGNGDLGNQGVHQVDLARWALGESGLSTRVLTVGGRVGYLDDGTTPNTLIVLHDYKRAPLLFEVRGLPAAQGSQEMDDIRGASVGLIVECEGGVMVIRDYSSARVFDASGKQVKSFQGASSHFANFIDAVHSRKPADLKAEVLEGHLSSALCHTANISYRLGRVQSPEEIRDAIKSSPDMAEMFGRMQEHLAANKLDPAVSSLSLGAALKFDPASERFVENPDANRLLTRDYRPPFVVEPVS